VKEGHFYIQAKKIGHLGCLTTWRKWYDFDVSAKFVWSLWKKRKIMPDSAIQEFEGARDNAAYHISNFQKGLQLSSQLRLQRAVRARTSQQPSRPFKPANDMEAAFFQQFLFRFKTEEMWRDLPATRAIKAETLANPNTTPERFRFLIYNGPSRLGKTERASHWFGTSKTRVLNCQGVTTPWLREFSRDEWHCIVYDEADWRLPAKQKMLFQSGRRPPTMSQSNCNESAYDVDVFAVPMIICSNDFWAGSDGQDMVSCAWIKENSFIVEITDKTWVE
jgi:hypothetical protein